jgi:hypothetical protein
MFPASVKKIFPLVMACLCLLVSCELDLAGTNQAEGWEPEPAVVVETSLWSISGEITRNDAGFSGVTLQLMLDVDCICTVQSDHQGRYRFTGLAPGNYRIRPLLDGFRFVPQFRDIALKKSDLRPGSFSALALQPVDYIMADPLKYFVKQDDFQCGPASFYTIFKYYGDNRRPYPFYYPTLGSPLNLYLTAVTSNGVDVLTGSDSVSAWIMGVAISTTWNMLVGAVRMLSFMADGALSFFYTGVASHDSETDNNDAGRAVRLSNFMEQIVPEFFEKNRPVIAHLKRTWPYPGHYLVLIGYDYLTETVYYMDPNGDESAPVGTVSLENFINEFWYSGPMSAWYGRARWSGRWLGFFRAEP